MGPKRASSGRSEIAVYCDPTGQLRLTRQSERMMDGGWIPAKVTLKAPLSDNVRLD